MKYRNFVIILFMITGIICICCVTGFFSVEDKQDEYSKVIRQLEYQLGYSEMYSTQNIPDTKEMSKTEHDVEIRTVYLTFDDGPSERTMEILYILKEYDIKATFFVVSNNGEKHSETLKRIYDEGHNIGVHSDSHSYKEIYKSVDSFLEDFETCYRYIETTTGTAPSIFRFPGGSINNYNKDVCKDIIDEMGRRGFTYFDWNVSSEDATKNCDEDSIYNNVVKGCSRHTNSVVLMHDSRPKKDTVAALKRIIPELLEQGYTFGKLDENVTPTVFKIE